MLFVSCWQFDRSSLQTTFSAYGLNGRICLLQDTHALEAKTDAAHTRRLSTQVVGIYKDKGASESGSFPPSGCKPLTQSSYSVAP